MCWDASTSGSRSAPAPPAQSDSSASTGSPDAAAHPWLKDALVAVECEIVAEHPAGDHWIVLGRVEDVRTTASGDPLVFFAGAFGSRAIAQASSWRWASTSRDRRMAPSPRARGPRPGRQRSAPWAPGATGRRRSGWPARAPARRGPPRSGRGDGGRRAVCASAPRCSGTARRRGCGRCHGIRDSTAVAAGKEPGARAVVVGGQDSMMATVRPTRAMSAAARSD